MVVVAAVVVVAAAAVAVAMAVAVVVVVCPGVPSYSCNMEAAKPNPSAATRNQRSPKPEKLNPEPYDKTLFLYKLLALLLLLL